jgi:hypothetical protein
MTINTRAASAIRIIDGKNPLTWIGMAEPCVGIFFLVEDRLLVDAVPLSQAEEYAEHLIHAGSHVEYWDELLAAGEVTGEYYDFSRGRVCFSKRDDRWSLLADPCILKREDVVQALLRRLNLPRTTAVATDSHYRCPGCMRKKQKARF